MKAHGYLCLLALLIATLCSSAQQYVIFNSQPDIGNPGNLRTVPDYVTTGGTSVLNGSTGSDTVNYWSDTVGIPFPFELFSTPVTHFIVSKNGLLTFDTTLANLPVDHALNVNTALPNPSLPDQTLAMFWEDTSNSSVLSFDHIYTYTYGTAPNRQFWIHYNHFEISGQFQVTMAAVLEETTNNIYVVDMNYVSSPANYSGTVGLQVNSSTAFDVSVPLNGTMGSPNIAMGSGSGGVSDNEYYKFEYFAPGACVPPSGLGATNLSSDSADLFWTSGSGASHIIEWDTSGFTLGTGTTHNTSSNTITITGLSPLTSYSFYVRDSCGPGDVSSWTGPFSFTTLVQGPQGVNCSVGIPTVVFSEEFDAQGLWTGDIGNSAGQWQINSGPTANFNTGPDSAFSGTNYIYFYDNGAAGTSGTMVSPAIDLSTASGGAELSFWMHAFGDRIDSLIVGVSTAPQGPFTTVFTYNGELQSSSSDPWQQLGVILDAYIGQVIYLQLKATRTGFAGDLALDLLEVTTCLNCELPTALTQTNSSSTSIDLGWTQTGTATQWEISYGPPGFTLGSGNQTGAGTNPYTLGGLTPNTPYHWYARAICGPGDTSSWVGPLNFTTLCSTQLSGAYTINSGQPTSGTNFTSFTDFVDVLNDCGVSGPVTVNVSAGSGPYTEQIKIQSITGASAFNTVTINGNSDTLQYAPTSTDRFVVHLEGTDHLTINDLVVLSTDVTYGWGIYLSDQADSNQITNCIVDVSRSTSTISSNSVGIVATGSPSSTNTAADNANYLLIDNCEVIGGYSGIRISGSSANMGASGNIIRNNTVRDFYSEGITLYHNNGAVVAGNDISRANRATVGTFQGITLNDGCRNVGINANRIHDTHNGASSQFSAAYGIYFSSVDAPQGETNIASNNLIYNFNSTTGSQYGLYNSGSDGSYIYHNTVVLDDNNSTSGITRGFNQVSQASDIDIANNIFYITRTGSGTKHCLYFGLAASTISSDNNVLFNDPIGGSNHVGYYNGNFTTLVNWQAANGNIYDQNSVGTDPVFLNPSGANFEPISAGVDNMGIPVGIANDINGNIRSLITPDAGAYEFTAVSTDISLITGNILKGQCLSTDDTVQLLIQNLANGPVDFSVDTLIAHWSITGPIPSNGTIIMDSGILPSGDTLAVLAGGANLSIPGTYKLNAYIEGNAANLVLANDTMDTLSFTVYPIFTVNPLMDTLFSPMDSTAIQATSPFIPRDTFFITELSLSSSSGSIPGSPTSGWPSYHMTNGYVEITGVPGTDLGGYSLELWNTTSLDGVHTFPSGTHLSPNGTAVIATFPQPQSIESPQDFYYHVDATAAIGYSSFAATGRVLKDPSGNIVDAVGINGYTFPSVAEVPASEWSNSILGGGSTAGIRLEGPDDNTGANWVLSTSSPQDPNVVNANVTIPASAQAVDFNWTLNGNLVDTMPNITVGPITTPGTYYYVASRTNTPCGTLTDTVTIVASFELNDISAATILPLDKTCGKDSMEVQAVISNVGGLSQSNFVLGLVVSGGLTHASSMVYTGTLDPGQIDTVTIGKIDTRNGGTYDLQVYTALNNDQRLSNDTVTVSGIQIFATPPAPAVPSQINTCLGGNATISAGPTPHEINWYAGPSAGTPIFVGDSLLLQNIVSDDTIFAEATSTLQEAVATPTYPGFGSILNQSQGFGLAFSLSSTTTIDSVTIYPTGSGSINLLVWDQHLDTLVYTSPSSSITGVPSGNTIHVGAKLPPGDYKIGMQSTGITGLGMNFSHPGFPYISPSGDLSITSGSSGLGPPAYTYYPFFYDWIITVERCSSERLPVMVKVQQPSLNIGQDTSFCDNTSLTLSANTGAGNSVSWSNGATGPDIQITNGGLYWAEATDTSGCSSRDSIMVSTLTAPTVNLGNDTTYCEDQSLSILLDVSWPNATYAWNDGSTNASITVTQPGQYWVMVTDNQGCVESDSILVSEHSLPTVMLGNDTTIDMGSTLTLNAGNPGGSFIWSTGATTQTLNVTTTGTYSVTVTDNNGCSNSDTIHVTVRTGIEGSPDITSMELFPNPTSGNLTLKISALKPGQLDLTVIDITGRALIQKGIKTHLGSQEYGLSIGHLSKGVYLVRIVWNKRVIGTLPIQLVYN